MSMKLIVAIVHNDDADDLIDGLTTAHFGATRLASTGGFLRQGNTTIIVGVSEEAVDEVVQIITIHSQNRRQSVSNPVSITGTNSAKANAKAKNSPAPGPVEQMLAHSLASNPGGITVEIQTGRATVFVLDLERYEHF